MAFNRSPCNLIFLRNPPHSVSQPAKLLKKVYGLMMQKLNFLVVDDASFIRDLVKRTLKSQFTQCHIDEAVNGKKAQSLLNKTRYDLVLCDWEMPELSGLELLVWFREYEQEQELEKTPFMMVTSRGEKSHVVKAVQAGVSDYIGKPFSSDQLLKKVFKLLSINHKELIRAILAGAAKMGKSTSGGLGGDSANVLTAKPVGNTKNVTQDAASGSAGLLTAGSVSSKLVNSQAQKVAGKSRSNLGKTTLRSPNSSWLGTIRDMTLTGATVVIDFAEQSIPTVLQQVVIDVPNLQDSDNPARLNTIITSVALTEKSIDCHTAAVQVYLVDDDQQKLEILSRFLESKR